MKHIITLKMKLQIFFMWMKKCNDLGLLEKCECCGSTKVKVKVTHSGENKDGYYCATYKCMNCEAECVVEEQWYPKKKGDK